MAKTAITTPITYTCFAFPPLDLTKSYSYGADEVGTYIVDGEGKKEYMELEVVKMLFSPKEKNWEDVLAVSSK